MIPAPAFMLLFVIWVSGAPAPNSQEFGPFAEARCNELAHKIVALNESEMWAACFPRKD